MDVDDVTLNLAILNAYVSAAGYTFIGMASGEECLELTCLDQAAAHPARQAPGGTGVGGEAVADGARWPGTPQAA